MDNLDVTGETVVVVGDSAAVQQVIGHQSNIFNYNQDSPAELFAAARKYLAINAPGRAVDLIERAMAYGLDSSEVAYYWQLALLADRPFDHLSQADRDKIVEGHRQAKSYTPDNWTAATQVVEDLLHCYTSRLSQGRFDEDSFGRAMSDFQTLAPGRREELVRHVSSLLEGTENESFDEEQRDQIRLHRMGDGRRVRVPLFFDPDPARPHLRSAAPPEVSAGTWAALGLGAGSCGWALYLLGRGAVRESWLIGGLTVAWVLVSCVALAVYGTRLADGRRRQDRHRDGVRAALLAGRPALDRLIARRFGVLVESMDPVVDFRVERALLAQTLSSAYPDPAAPEHDWLIRWHAQEVRSGRSSVDPPEVTGHAEALASAGSLALAVLTQVVLIAQWSLPVVFTLLASGTLLSLGSVLLRAGIGVFTEPRRHHGEMQRNERLFAAEEVAWAVEMLRLRDRPGDGEMARWLDFDTLQIRLAAMKQWGLSNDDVLAHVVLTEPDPDSRTARETGCPRRHARYVVRLFLLTGNGVRQLDVKLDFASGAENDQQRRAFKYDAIASAVITEPTVRKFGRRQVATFEGGGPEGQVRPIRRQSLTLTLVNGEKYEINADYESGLAPENVLDPEALAALEMETSGAVSTLRTLESVAGEGREWIAREKERLRAAARDYQRAGVGTVAL